MDCDVAVAFIVVLVRVVIQQTIWGFEVFVAMVLVVVIARI
jgi:hypothetical protein